MAHRFPREFRFTEERQLMVFVCKKVHDGAPILYVSHDEEGDWQFLCGGQHGEEAPEDPGLVHCLECTVAGDESVNEVADLEQGAVAFRDSHGGPWERPD